MTSEESDSANENGLLIRSSTDLISLPEGGSPALSEIISRSLAHIQASKALAMPARRAGEEQEFEIAPGVKIVMCWIPPGEFLMGSPMDEVGRMDDNEIQHRVTISLGFWLGKYPVTQAQWVAVIGSNPSYFNGSDLPVEFVSWDAISEPGGFLEKVNEFALHEFAAAGGIFTLPTEAQWEYACRAGTTTAWNNGKNSTCEYDPWPDLKEVAWFVANSENMTHPVGQKKANNWGLHDMHGNVFEWCADWYEDPTFVVPEYPQGPVSGSPWPRVYRGGGYSSNCCFCRSAVRYAEPPSEADNEAGFRIARSSVPSSVQKFNDVEAYVADDGKLHSLPKPTTWIVP